MSVKESKTESLKQESFFTRILLLALIGAGISSYLSYHHVVVNNNLHSGPSLCSISEAFDCDKVARSEYSLLLGIPVANLGLAFYLLLSGVVILGRRKGQLLRQGEVFPVLWLWSILAAGVSLYLGAVSFIAIETVCLFCSILYLINVCLAVITALSPEIRGDWFARALEGVGITAAFPLKIFEKGCQIKAAGTLGLALAVICGALFLPKMLIDVGAVDVGVQEDKVLRTRYNVWKASKQLDLELTSPAVDRARGTFSFGPADAEVSIVEFSDFQCPHCRTISSQLKSLVKEFGVKVYFKNYPLDPSCNDGMKRALHDQACNAARYARCAGMQDEELFWRMHDEIFRYPEVTESRLESLPAKLDLDLARFQTCLEDPQTTEAVRADIALGDKVGVSGTPTVFINNRKLASSSRELMAFTIRQFLAESSRTSTDASD